MYLQLNAYRNQFTYCISLDPLVLHYPNWKPSNMCNFKINNNNITRNRPTDGRQSKWGITRPKERKNENGNESLLMKNCWMVTFAKGRFNNTWTLSLVDYNWKMVLKLTHHTSYTDGRKETISRKNVRWYLAFVVLK